MDLRASEEAGFESLFFWDMDSTPEEFKKWMEENGFSEIIGNNRDEISDQID